jgi:hypothetical protein
VSRVASRSVIFDGARNWWRMAVTVGTRGDSACICSGAIGLWLI